MNHRTRLILVVPFVLFIAACASIIPIKVGPTPNVTIAGSSEQILRGEYLAKHVMFCNSCHSKADWTYFSGPVIPGTEGMGGEAYIEPFGTIYASNITPAALGDWTDGEIVQALTEGISRNGDPLFPIMPSSRYQKMDPEDLYAVVAYIRTLEPIQNDIPKKSLKFPFKLIERTFPAPAQLQARPDKSDQVAYGKYLATIGDCISCHTPMTKTGKPQENMLLAGGNGFPQYGGENHKVYSSNITGDEATGIGNWDEAFFIERFKGYEYLPGLGEPAKSGSNTVMPWSAYAGMAEEDLAAIYAYLMSVESVNNEVIEWQAP
jgi:mono/diheme cytochrome c family protein